MQCFFTRFCRLSFWIILSLLIAEMFFVSGVYAADSLRIIAFGDSITTGYPYYPYWDAQDGEGNGTTGGGYEPATSSDLISNGILATVYNWGVSGEFAADGVNRLEYVLNRQSADYVLLMEGTNDLTFYFGCGSVIQSLSLMIDKVAAHGEIPLLSTMTPDSRSGLGYKDIPYCNEQIKKLAMDKNVYLVDNYQAVIDNWHYWGGYTYEGLHPSSSGYSVLGKSWSQGIQAVIQSNVISPAIMLLLMKE